jgi:hypothetical protein
MRTRPVLLLRVRLGRQTNFMSCVGIEVCSRPEWARLVDYSYSKINMGKGLQEGSGCEEWSLGGG